MLRILPTDVLQSQTTTPFRKHNSQWALDKAKFNVQNFFAVVGILEDLEKTLRLLERKLPQYFSGALELHTSSSGNIEQPSVAVNEFATKWHLLLSEHIVNKGKNKKADVAQEIKDIIRKNLTAEYEFYEFIRGRLQAELKNNEQ